MSCPLRARTVALHRRKRREESGNRAGTATSLSQIGVLLTETGRSDYAIVHNLSALSMRLEMRLPQAGTRLHWLERQRAELGEDRFWELAGGHLDQDSLAALARLLDQEQQRQ